MHQLLYATVAALLLLAVPFSTVRSDIIQLDLNQLSIVQKSEGGDEPYLITVAVRSQWNTPGSTRATWSRYGGRIGEELQTGATRPIPAQMAFVEFRDVNPVPVAQVAAGARPEFFLVLVAALENDNWTASGRRNFGDQLRDSLERNVAPLIEQGQLNIFDPGMSAADLTASVREDLSPDGFFEELGVFLSSAFNPDEFVDSHAIAIAGLTDGPIVTDGDLTLLGQPGGLTFADGTALRFSGEGADWRASGSVNYTGCVPVYSWWSSERQDNFLTTDPRWGMPLARVQFAHDGASEHLEIQKRSDDGAYSLYRLEGYAFDPRGPQPAGMVPLVSWWSGTRGDNFATTDPRWEISPVVWAGEHLSEQPRSADGVYTGYRLEGFVFDPRVAQPAGSVPLVSWWSGARGDNFATTDPTWAIPNIVWNGEHLANQPVSADGVYQGYRLEGFLFDPKGPIPDC